MGHSPETKQPPDEFVIWLSREQLAYLDRLLRRRLTTVTARLRNFHAKHPFGPSPYLEELSLLHGIEWAFEAAWLTPKRLMSTLAASKAKWQLTSYGWWNGEGEEGHDEETRSESEEQP
jgi:hypothetical protein